MPADSIFTGFFSNLLKFILILSLFTSTNCQIHEGDPCKTNDNALGVCKKLVQCQSELNYLPQTQIKVCATAPVKLICCRVPQSLSTTNNGSTGICQYPNYAITVKRDEYNYKSWNKCIDLADSVFPCEEKRSFYRKFWSRSDTCKNKAHNLVIGGEKAKPNEFPHMAVLGYENRNKSIVEWKCGGSLISDQWVMSAAHCHADRTLNVNVSLVRLGGGDLNVSEPEFMFNVIRWVIHSNFDRRTKHNDIALFQLDRVVKFSSVLRPACLHVGNDVNDSKVIALGYGRSDYYDNSITSNELLKVIIEKFSNEDCLAHFTNAHLSHPDGQQFAKQMCYGSHNDTRDTCSGDSGGPIQIFNTGVYCTYTVIGITSQGVSCGNSHIPALYTKVSAFIPWIESIVWPN